MSVVPYLPDPEGSPAQRFARASAALRKEFWPTRLCLLPAAATILVVTLYWFSYHVLITCAIPQFIPGRTCIQARGQVLNAVGSAELGVGEIAARLTWQSSVVLLTVASIFAVAL